MGQTGLRVCQLGKETTFGTQVAATAKFMGVSDLKISPVITNTQRRYLQGDYAPAHAVALTDQRGKASLSGDFSFEDWPMLMLSALKGGVTAVGAGADKTWTFPFPLLTDPALESRTFEMYDAIQEYALLGGLVESFSLSGAATPDGVVQFSANLIGVDAPKGTLTAALANHTYEPLPAGKVKLYIDDLGGTIGTTIKADTLISWKLDVKTGAHLKKFQAGALKPSAKGAAAPEVKLAVTAEFNAASVAEVDKYIAGTGRLYRLIGLGSLVTGSIYKTLQIDLAMDIVDIGDLWGDRDGNTTADFTLAARYDAGTFAEYGKLVVINAAATMPG